MGKWIDIYSDPQTRTFIGRACTWEVFLEIRDFLQESITSSQTLASDFYFQYQLSIAEEWKTIPLDRCTTLTIEAVRDVLEPLAVEHPKQDVREVVADVVVKIDEALALVEDRRRRLDPRTRLFLILEDRAIFSARNLCAAKILAKEPVNPPDFMIKQGWPGRGDFFSGGLSERKRPYWIRPTRTRRRSQHLTLGESKAP